MLTVPYLSPVRQFLPALTLGVHAPVIALVTLFKSRFEVAGLWDAAAHEQRSLDLELFNGFVAPAVWYGPWINTLGNVLLFIPLGFLLHLLFRHRLRHPLLGTFLAATAVSFGIEAAQFIFALGYSDVDDLLTNSLGAWLGALLATRVPRRGRRWLTVLTLLGSLAGLAVAGVGRTL